MKKRTSNKKVTMIYITIGLALIVLMSAFSLTVYNDEGHGGTIISLIVASFLFVVLVLATIREGQDD